MSHFHFVGKQTTLFRPHIPKMLPENVRIITIQNGDIEKSVLINYEEGADSDYTYCKGSAAWPDSKHKLKYKDRLVLFRVDFEHSFNGREVTWSVDTPKMDEIATPKDFQDYKFEKMEYSEETDSLLMTYVKGETVLGKEEAMTWTADLAAAPTFNKKFYYIFDYENEDYKAQHVKVANQTWHREEDEGRVAAKKMLPNGNSSNVFEQLSFCVDLIDDINGYPDFPFYYLPHAAFNNQFTFYSNGQYLKVWDKETGEITRVGKLPGMAACVDFTILNVFQRCPFAKLFVFINPHKGENVVGDDCTLKCGVGWFWCKKQEKMVYFLLREVYDYPDCLVKKLLEFVR